MTDYRDIVDRFYKISDMINEILKIYDLIDEIVESSTPDFINPRGDFIFDISCNVNLSEKNNITVACNAWNTYNRTSDIQIFFEKEDLNLIIKKDRFIQKLYKNFIIGFGYRLDLEDIIEKELRKFIKNEI